MKGVILIISDSFRADHLGCYGSGLARTPKMNKFAKKSALFDRAYIASYPTVPNRLDVWTGRYNFPYRGWEPLVSRDVTLPGVLGKHGITSYLVFDTPFLVVNNFGKVFDGWWQERGHHSDRVVTDPEIPINLPAAPHKLKNLEGTKQFLRNKAAWRFEKDYVAPRTFMKAMEWLEANRNLDNFFLLVDTWDPHEPFDPPIHYLEMYADTNEEVDNVIYPVYGHTDFMTKADIQRVRALYAGEVSMVDTWTGLLLETVDRLGLSESTMIIFTTDHGHLFGEHGLEGKPTGQLGRLYEITTRIPLIIRHPDGIASGSRIEGIVQPPDIMPTILDFFGVPVPETVHGKSVLPLMTGDAESLHKYAFSARFPEGQGTDRIAAQAHDGWTGLPQVLSPVTVTTREWALICSPEASKSELYDLKTDPSQECTVLDENPDVKIELREAFISFMEQMKGRKNITATFKSGKQAVNETLPPNLTIYTIRDTRDITYAYLNHAEASQRVSQEMTSQKVKPIKFETLQKRDPKAMIFIGQQYYYAKELSGS